MFKEEKYLKEAAECAEVIWQRGLLRKGYGICHGTAGNGYAFLSLYKLTQEKKYLYRACKVRVEKQPKYSTRRVSNLIWAGRDVRFSCDDRSDQKMDAKEIYRRVRADFLPPLCRLLHHGVCSTLVGTLRRQLASWMLPPVLPLYASDSSWQTAVRCVKAAETDY